LTYLQANYVAAELRNPSRQLPLSINTAIPTIILCYVAANAVYYILLPWEVVSTTDAAAVVCPIPPSPQKQTPANHALQTAVTHFLGKTPAYFATALICLGNSFVAGRMTVAASNNNWIPRFFGSVGHIANIKISSAADSRDDAEDAMDKGESPINALILNTVLATVYILAGNMRILLTLNGLAEYAFFFLTVLGAIILRVREPELPRPVKPYVVVPVVFAVISGFVVVRGAVFAPVQAAVLLGIWGVGAVFYYVRLYMLGRGMESD
jgi:L-type amino acid transporter 9